MSAFEAFFAFDRGDFFFRVTELAQVVRSRDRATSTDVLRERNEVELGDYRSNRTCV